MGEVELLFVKENNKLRAKEPEINLEGRDGDRVKLNERQPMISTTSTAKNTFYLQTKQEQNCQREKINNSTELFGHISTDKALLQNKNNIKISFQFVSDL